MSDYDGVQVSGQKHAGKCSAVLWVTVTVPPTRLAHTPGPKLASGLCLYIGLLVVAGYKHS